MLQQLAMATIAILITALTAGSVLSQSTTGESDTSLEGQIEQLQQQQSQMFQMLGRILDQQQQILGFQQRQPNERQRSLADNAGMWQKVFFVGVALNQSVNQFIRQQRAKGHLQVAMYNIQWLYGKTMCTIC